MFRHRSSCCSSGETKLCLRSRYLLEWIMVLSLLPRFQFCSSAFQVMDGADAGGNRLRRRVRWAQEVTRDEEGSRNEDRRRIRNQREVLVCAAGVQQLQWRFKRLRSNQFSNSSAIREWKRWTRRDGEEVKEWRERNHKTSVYEQTQEEETERQQEKPLMDWRNKPWWKTSFVAST